jgi:hypothetical protein
VHGQISFLLFCTSLPLFFCFAALFFFLLSGLILLQLSLSLATPADLGDAGLIFNCAGAEVRHGCSFDEGGYGIWHGGAVLL